MEALLTRALEAINLRIIAASGQIHPDINNPDDRNAATELFQRLHVSGIVMAQDEIENWAQQNGWLPNEAKELGALARLIESGEDILIAGGPWWQENILDTLSRTPTRLADESCPHCLLRVEDGSGSEECLMEVIRSQWAEPFGDTRYCEHPDAKRFVNLANSCMKRFDDRNVRRG